MFPALSIFPLRVFDSNNLTFPKYRSGAKSPGAEIFPLISMFILSQSNIKITFVLTWVILLSGIKVNVATIVSFGKI